jgi:hypothetical protein
MNLTKKVIAGVLIAGFLTTFLALPKAAEAGGGWHGHHNSAAPFWGGLAFGAITGLVVGAAVAPRAVYAAPAVVYQAPPTVVYQAPPVVVYQPAPVCTSYWVNPYWNGYQWVQGYWAQACR